MMLETIKNEIKSAQESPVDFSQFYNNYIMQVQDQNIISEVKHYINRNIKDLQDIEDQIDLDFKQLVG